MKAYHQVLLLAMFGCWTWSCLPARALAQRPIETEAERTERLARRGAGVRAGYWAVDIASDADVSRSPHMEAYVQRGLDRHLALENSVGVWWLTTTTTQALPDAPEVLTRTYVVPLLASVKFYPLTAPRDRLEPFVLGGVGIAFGIEDEGENAIGGGGTLIVTGLGARAAVGAEFRLGAALGLSASGKYQWLHFAEDLGTSDTFSGVGVEGGVTYRFGF